MTKLECHVTECASNAENSCCRNDIKISGPCACGCEQTCCASFEERRAGSAQNAMGQNPTVETDIRCHVQSCSYNSNQRCDAQCVCVGCGCGDVTSKSGTECRTFQNK